MVFVMLIIRRQTYDLFAEQSLNRFRVYLFAAVDRLPDKIRDDVDAYGRTSFIDEVIDRADIHNIELEKDIESLFELMAVYGLDFGENEETAWAKDILSDNDLDGELKMQRIHMYLEDNAPEE